jgi:heat shock protein HslJ
VAGRAFVLQSQQGASLLSGADLRVSFTDTEVSAHAYCNHLFGHYQLEENRLIVPGMGGTEMGCESQYHRQDEWISTFLASKPTAELSGSTLTLRNAEATLVLLDRVEADPDRPLQATVWEINTYIEGEGAMGLMEIAPPKLVFATDGTWTLRATCTEGHGTYTQSKESITLANSQFTDVLARCGTDNDREAAQRVRAVLADGELRVRIEARSLDLRRGGRGVGALAVR